MNGTIPLSHHSASLEPPQAEPARKPLVQFQSVKKSYDGKSLVVKDLNLDVGEGEFLTMLGPSGSGKTTTLMMLGGFERPTSGHILLDGKAVEKLPPEKRNIGFVFQNYALFPHMTVAENIAFPLRYRNRSRAETQARVARALSMVHLDTFGDRKPGQLSGGQQQRVALARALVFEPSLVLMDEPLGALDKQLREHMQFEIKKLQVELGITMVYVTHDQSEALTMSDRIAVFHDGMIQQCADPVTLYNAPVNRFVASFIGDNNLLPCQLKLADKDRLRVAMADGSELDAINPPAGRINDLSLSIRPERTAVAGKTSSPPHNRLQARVGSLFFQGDHVRLTLEAFGSDALVAHVAARDAAGLRAGDRAAFEVPFADCRILEA